MTRPWDEGARKRMGPEVPITSRSVRLPIRTFVENDIKRRLYAADIADELWGDSPGQLETTRYVRTVLDTGRVRVGRPSLSDEFLKQVADAFRQAEREGDRNTNVAVWRWANDHGFPCSPATARVWVTKAREREFLAGGKKRKVRPSKEES